jgi:superkiller protein 3
VEAFFDLALSQQASGQAQVAIKSYQKFLLAFPEDFQAHYLLGLAYRDESQGDLALEQLQIAERIDPSHKELSQELGNLLLDRGDLEEAQMRLLRADPESAANLGNLGIIAKRQGDPAQAESYLRRGLEKEPDNAALWIQLGEVFSAQQKEREAVEAYQRALRYKPRDFGTLLNLGTLLFNLDQAKQARRLLEQAVEVNPDDGLANYNLALVLDEAKDLDQAQVRYLKALDHGVDSAHAHFRLTYLWARQGAKEQALEHLQQAFEKEAETYVRLAAEELLQVSSDWDSIRYTDEFNQLLEQYWDRME